MGGMGILLMVGRWVLRGAYSGFRGFSHFIINYCKDEQRRSDSKGSCETPGDAEGQRIGAVFELGLL